MFSLGVLLVVVELKTAEIRVSAEKSHHCPWVIWPVEENSKHESLQATQVPVYEFSAAVPRRVPENRATRDPTALNRTGPRPVGFA